MAKTRAMGVYESCGEHDSARSPPLTVYAGREALSPQEIVHVDHVYGSLLQYAFSCAPWSLTLTGLLDGDI